jgi:hypothetical protein
MTTCFLVKIINHEDKGYLIDIIDSTNTDVVQSRFGSRKTGENGILESFKHTLDCIETEFSKKITLIVPVSITEEERKKGVKEKYLIATTD